VRTFTRKRVLSLLAAVALIAAAVVGWQYWTKRNSAPEYLTSQVERGDIVASVSASGTLNPVKSVSVGSQVSGQIRELLVDYNSRVRQGDIVARINPQTYESRVQEAEANLQAARASLLSAQSELNRQRVTTLNLERDLKRKRELLDKNFISAAEFDTNQSAYDAQKAVLTSAEAQVANSQAQVKQREALLYSARTELEKTIIRAPVDGTVIKRSVEPGQTVAASLQAPELFIIAQDLTAMQVEVSVDEADVGRIREGQEATFTVDAFPGQTFRGEVMQVRKASLVVQNVVTYVVVVSAANRDQSLLPGMTANVRIVTARRDNALRIPNSALRFRLPGETASAGTRQPGAPTSAGSGPGPSAMKERLVSELKLDEKQQARLDEILENARQQRAARAAEGNGAQNGTGESGAAATARRPGGNDAQRDAMRAQINAILTPEQQALYAAMNAGRQGSARGATTSGTLYVLREGKPAAVDVRLGLSDGNATELVRGEIKEGDAVITGVRTTSGDRAGSGARSQPRGPRMF
jgi:HlyD family secretion protein